MKPLLRYLPPALGLAALCAYGLLVYPLLEQGGVLRRVVLSGLGLGLALFLLLLAETLGRLRLRSLLSRAAARLKRLEQDRDQRGDLAERLEQELRRQVVTDPLTGTANREHLLRQSQAELDRAQGPGPCLLLLDLDHLGRLNHVFGFPAGDEALKMLGRYCRKISQRPDLVGRLNGGTFGLLLLSVAEADARKAAETIRQAVANFKLSSAQGPVGFTVSLGLAAHDPARQDVGDLLRRAEQALAEAKRRGRDRVAAAWDLD